MFGVLVSLTETLNALVPPLLRGARGDLRGKKHTLGAIALKPPLSPQQQEFQSNQIDNSQSLD